MSARDQLSVAVTEAERQVADPTLSYATAPP
jgi:hypothetical protein